MNKLSILAFVVLVAFVSGCATRQYAWNNYDGVLYQHYKNPQENEVFLEKLQEIVREGEVSGNVPPGVYAEYGFALYEKGQYEDATKFFQKEHDKWPESRTLMRKMIANSTMRNKTGTQQTSTSSQTK